MKPQTKQKIWKAVKIFWLCFGAAILLLNILFQIKVHTFSGSGFAGLGGAIGLALLSGLLLGALLVFAITLIAYAIRKLKRK